ncbi:helix-turn-helix domain-containing protein [Dyadobacter subterraneus]|uniref:Helix-turn-helix transcriptional regulator n=1 Tax=Dyadobacter subterraneus TaxID=2773304 RepID=A0ABR9W7H1_9BACT|nr:helix-turn-helix transcriptional regulator [Dyadobacter subterraneus]MBE9461402.1 helix-turn-helix transcriptional regulator [Dyadobacter subterraneus]
MSNIQPHRFKTIAEFHKFRGLPKPEHPLISVINVELMNDLQVEELHVIKDFYSIAMKRNINFKVKYGQNSYDFDEGVMFFMSAGQLVKLAFEKDEPVKQSGWMLLIHPDFLWNTSLAKTIKQYEYFSYAVNEALFLSEKEETMVTGIVQYMEQEYHANIDQFSQTVILAQLELLLTYADRFYQRQFITRKIANHQILARLEDILDNYFKSDNLVKNGLPTVSFIADALNVSPNYLGSMLKVLTGQNAQQHLHSKLIELAKEKLSTTDLSVSEIAYALGFEHSQSFSKLFKNKTDLSPLEFRQSFN